MTSEQKPTCCVCGEEDGVVAKEHSCSEDQHNHDICKTCFLSVLQMCYCNNTLGEVVYKCPLCRNQHFFSNKEMNDILTKMNGNSELCMKVHAGCENKNVTKKCQFENCGCRTNVVDVITSGEIDLAIKDIISVANRYKKGLKSPMADPKNI